MKAINLCASLMILCVSIADTLAAPNPKNPQSQPPVNANRVIYRLERTSTTGFTLAENAVSSSCSISANGVLTINHNAAGLTSSKRDKIAITGEMPRLIAEAAEGSLSNNPYPVDANSIAYRIVPDKFPPYVKASTIVLFEQNGGNGSEQINTSPSAVVLRNFIDLNCGPLPSAQTTPVIPDLLNFSVIMQFGKGWEYRYADSGFLHYQPTVIKDAATLAEKWSLWFDENQQAGSRYDGNGKLIFRPVYPVMPDIDFSKEMLVVIFGAEQIKSIEESPSGIDVNAVYHVTKGFCFMPAIVYGPSVIIAKRPRSDKSIHFSTTNIEVPCGNIQPFGPKTLN